jgi:hypothetical protein
MSRNEARAILQGLGFELTWTQPTTGAQTLRHHSGAEVQIEGKDKTDPWIHVNRLKDGSSNRQGRSLAKVTIAEIQELAHQACR